MRHSPASAALLLSSIRTILDNKEEDSFKLVQIWSTLGHIHNHMLANTLRSALGDSVFTGPFKGMRLTPAVMVKAYGPLLAGIYEHELHPVIERIVATPYDVILNIGSSFGYYSIGLARRMPKTAVYAFDILESEQQRCAEMATLNNVQDRVKTGGLFAGENFSNYKDKKTLVILDIEGGEMELLDPARFPALQGMDVLVELHDVFNPEISKTIRERFSVTHDIEMIYNKPSVFDFGSVLGEEQYVDPLDSFLIAWENRGGPTPWAYMRAKAA